MPAKSPETALKAIICSCRDRLPEAQRLARQFQVPLLDSGQGLSDSGALLHVADSLQLSQPGLGHPIHVDFDDPALLKRLKAGRRQPLARACGLHKQRNLHILDCTAGLGQDMLTLAAQGAQVTPLERNAVIFRLLEDGFTRGGHNALALRALANCQAPLNLDAIEYLQASRNSQWDVIFIDPMFSGYRRRALPGKAMQLLAGICGADEDADELLKTALDKAGRRVVVKRSPQAPLLQARDPDMQIKGSRVRYDIYLNA